MVYVASTDAEWTPPHVDVYMLRDGRNKCRTRRRESGGHAVCGSGKVHTTTQTLEKQILGIQDVLRHGVRTYIYIYICIYIYI